MTIATCVERNGNWSEVLKRPDAPALDDWSVERPIGARYDTNLSSTTFESRSDQDGARSSTCAQYEEMKQRAGVTSRSEVRHPLWKQSDLRNGNWSEVLKRPDAPALDDWSVERPTGARYDTNLSSTTFESWSDQDGERSLTRAQYEEMKQRAGATSRSEVRHPLWKQGDLVERLP
ncbi:hypothetical protein F2Q70_00018287 [Brassica cretica]|uniref:Uncharacterized protein n=1 Tax=Brassica cretica TaxID=69181 RepID=A0A8S9I022_BRACR|nr:hypothetical protein F2Q70_00018287 [Brassica cretica]